MEASLKSRDEHDKKPAAKVKPKDIVYALMECDKSRMVRKRKNDGDIVEVECTTFKCIYTGCTKSVQVENGTGFTNPYKHLCTHYSEKALVQLYNDAIEKQVSAGGQGKISDHFQASFASPSEQIAMHDYIELLVMKSLPVSIVEDQLYRNFSKHSIQFGYKRVREVIFQLVEIVEKEIAKELKAAPMGSIMHDGWTSDGMHYVGVFACYIRRNEQSSLGKRNETPIIKETPAVVLLAVAPIQDVADNESDGEAEADITEEAAEFTAECHFKFFKETFKYYDLAFPDWIVASIADNTRTNLKIARMLKVAHVGCNNHKLNLDVERWCRNHAQLRETLESIHESMLAAKRKLKNAALLRNRTELKAVVHNKTRWSGKYKMLQRWIIIRDDLIEVANSDESVGLAVNASDAFLSRVQKFTEQFHEVNEVTLWMQTRCLTLLKCRESLDILVREVNRGRTIAGDRWFQCQFQSAKTLPDSDLVPNPHFESGVVKIQKGRVAHLTDAEKEAVQRLKKVIPGVQAVVAAAGNRGYSPLNMRQRIQREIMHAGHPSSSDESVYVNCDFIFGSAAEVERLWSICDDILTDHRKSLTPQLFEALAFLRVNKRFWGQKEVNLANVLAKTAMAKQRIARDLQQLELLYDDDDDDE